MQRFLQSLIGLGALYMFYRGLLALGLLLPPDILMVPQRAQNVGGGDTCNPLLSDPCLAFAVFSTVLAYTAALCAAIFVGWVTYIGLSKLGEAILDSLNS